MFIQIHTPVQPLRTFVKSIIYYKGYTATRPYEMLLPDGNSQLIIELDGNDRVLMSQHNQANQSLNRGWITGIQTNPVIYQSERQATTISIQFEPSGLFALFKVPATKFQDSMVDTASVSTEPINELRDKLLECETIEAILDQTNRFLEERLLSSKSNQKLVRFVINQLCLHNQPLGQISTESGYSQKQLIQIFKDHVGVSPKRYQRIHRFSRSLSILASQPSADYSQILAACNYYDQAHFINEFRHFSGYRPSQYHSMSLDYPHVISLSEIK